MRRAALVASVFVVASVAMPSMAHAQDKPIGNKSHIGKCKTHMEDPQVSRKGHSDKSADSPAKSDKGLNNWKFNSPGLNNQSLITGIIIRCR